jgi:RNA recognition motif-containing protein
MAANTESSSVWIQNLNFDTTKDDLEAAIAAVAPATKVSLLGGRNRGRAIVQFASPADANAVVEKLNDQELDGRPMKMRIFVEKPERATNSSVPAGSDEGRRRGGADKQYRRSSLEEGEDVAEGKVVYVGNLPWAVDDEQLKDIFAQFKAVRAKVARRRGREGALISAGYGTVAFGSAADAQAAISGGNALEVEGRPISVRRFEPKE